MRVAYFDPIGGASGDMILASLVDAGLDVQKLQADLKKLGLEGYDVEAEKGVHRQIACTRFHVHVHHHHHHHDHEHDSGHGHQHGRHLAEIEQMIGGSELPEGVKENALKVFRLLGEAEAAVHGTTVEKIHFHEVGAVDSIVDIVGACLGFHMLGIERLYVGPLPLSRGTVKCAHGEWPVPGPATTKLLQGFRWRNTDIEGELVTPTAAAIFAALGEDSAALPPFTQSATGYGAGDSDFGVPNVLRVVMGDTAEKETGQEEVFVVETSLDDQNPELLDYVMERLFEAGALDVWMTPVHMKKNRSAVVLSALAAPAQRQAVADIILRETSTLGVRMWPVERRTLERAQVTVDVAGQPVLVKIGRLDNGSAKMAPEYDSVRAAARRTGRPALEIYNDALRAALESREEQQEA